MKYLLIAPIWGVFFALSILLGCIMFLWRFSKEDFFRGTRYINTNIVQFDKWMNK